MVKQAVCFTHFLSPGDIVVMTAAIRDMATIYPDEFDILVSTSCSSIWENNPHVTNVTAKGRQHIKTYRLDYGRFIAAANTVPQHFITAFHQDIKKHLGLVVPVLKPHGAIYLSKEHKEISPVDGRYWVVIAGGKDDATVKVWSADNWQKTIYQLRDRGLRFVQCGTTGQHSFQPVLDGVLNVVNKTTLRDLIWMIQHADGVMCHVTAAMHIAAALNKPCVVVAGGREHWWWEAYVNTKLKTFGPNAEPVKVPHKYLHTQGLLPCCADKGCWKNKVTAAEKDKRRQYCKKPVYDDVGQHVPGCMKMITPNHVTAAVLSYYTEGILPPI